MDYYLLSFISVTIFALVHLFAEKTRALDLAAHSRFLSTGSGVAVAYIFIDLLPKLSKSDLLVTKAIGAIYPFLERHVYIMALIGFLLFFAVDQTQDLWRKQRPFFWLSLGSYALFNFLMGYAIVDKDNPEVRPLALFTLAISLHYFMNDFSLCEAHGNAYRFFGKWVLIICLFLGWLTGLWFSLSQTGIALASAFIGGGVIMNVTRHELSEEAPHSLGAFLLASTAYTIILLAVG